MNWAFKLLGKETFSLYITDLMYDLLFIDHDDSFSNNLRAWLEEGTEETWRCEMVPFEDPQLTQALLKPRPIILSPGPGHPQEKTSSLQVIREFLGKRPILGVCLGHQLLGFHDGARVVPAQDPWHGRTIECALKLSSFANDVAPERLAVMSYNSLVVERSSLSAAWNILATGPHGEIQGMHYCGVYADAMGLQFHPESFKTAGASFLRDHWRQMCSSWQKRQTFL